MSKETMKNKLETALEKMTSVRHSSNLKKRGGEAVVYTRVSSLEQAQNNGSLEVQLKYCNNYAITHKITIRQYFGGTYESAKTDGRKEFVRMLEFVKKNKSITYIIVFNYDRFSRSGSAASHLSEELGKEGVIVKSVTQDIDTSNAIGRLQENFFHMLNNFDNRLKSDRTTINTREVMLKGFWPYTTPLGYKNLKPKHRACFHEYVITNEGRELKKGFEMLKTKKYKYQDIIDYLQKRGVKISCKSFRQIFSNPFYTGFVTGKLVEGKLIKGKHPRLIDMKTFLAVQDILSDNPRAGIPKINRHIELPLKCFMRDSISNQPFSGYQAKGNWYYKIKKGVIPVNEKAQKINDLFLKELTKFEYNPSTQKRLEALLVVKLKERLSSQTKDAAKLKKALADKKSQLEKIENKFINDQISEEIFKNHTTKIKNEIEQINKETDSAAFNGSNLEKCGKKMYDYFTKHKPGLDFSRL